MKEFEYSSVMQAPKVLKVVINMGIGDAIANSKALDEAVAELTQLAGQKCGNGRAGDIRVQNGGI